MIVELFFLFLTLAFYWAYAKYSASQKLLVGYKGPKGLPILGNILDFPSGDILERM